MERAPSIRDDGPVRRPGAGAGDLGRRIAARRADLGLTRADLARHSGVSVPYLRYVEDEPSHPPADTLRALARVLRTTADDLLGGTQGRAPGAGPSTTGSRLAVVPEDECWMLLSTRGVGRIAFVVAEEVLVLPVNYVSGGHLLQVRTPPKSELATHVDPEGRVTVEVDRLDEATSGGWSVLIHGIAGRRSSRGGSSPVLPVVRPWVSQVRSLLITIRPDAVSGRRIVW